MADSPAADPVKPPPPAAPIKAPLPTGWIVVIVVMVLAVGALAVDRLWSRPKPVPAPVVPAVPVVPDVVPKALITGFYWPGPPSPVLTSGGDPAPLGMFFLDASTSTGDRPLRWQAIGPDGSPVKLRTFSPDGAMGSSISEAYATVPGTYYFHATAIGTVKGVPEVHTDSASFTVEAPKPPGPPPTPTPDPTPGPPTPPPVPPKPPGPPPLPGPDPTPPPGPKPFPSTSTQAIPGGDHVG